MKEYPLYDVPWLVRDPNAFRMSEAKHQTEVRNQAVVDDYFVARANGASAFGKIFHLGRNTKVGFSITFASDFEKRTFVILSYYFHNTFVLLL